MFAATLVLLALSGGLILAMLAMFMTGAAWEAMFVEKLTWIQHDAPQGDRRLVARRLPAAHRGPLVAPGRRRPRPEACPPRVDGISVTEPRYF